MNTLSRSIALFRSSALLLVLCLLTPLSPATAAASNPPAPGFDEAGSDAKAIALADEVMLALGGRKAWDDTHYITWRFFGGRRHVWDKFTGRLRFEDKDLVVLMNLNDETGRAWKAGVEVTEGGELKQILDRTKGAWINDSYWLLMPYKLKDSGVTLNYLGRQTDEDGREQEVLQLTFKNVGRTPDNKYHVFIDPESHLVTSWTYWKDASVDEPRSLGPWRDWTRYGQIMLTPDHGERKHSEIVVYDDLPDAVFESPSPAFDVSAYPPAASKG